MDTYSVSLVWTVPKALLRMVVRFVAIKSLRHFKIRQSTGKLEGFTYTVQGRRIKGCEWQGELNDISNHLGNSDGCQFEEVKCSNECGKMIERRYLTSHVETECPRHKVNCQYCHDTGEHQFIEGQHKEECLELPLPCPNNCDADPRGPSRTGISYAFLGISVGISNLLESRNLK